MWPTPLPYDAALRRLLDTVITSAPTHLGHVELERMVIVAGAARRATRASIRPLTFGGRPLRFSRGRYQKPEVRRGHEVALYELCLRPHFFRSATPAERLEILVHELWHLHPSFDGRLDPKRRHPLEDPSGARRFLEEVMNASRVEARKEPVLSQPGLWSVPMWLERPPSLIPPGRATRTHYVVEADTFLGVVEQL